MFGSTLLAIIIFGCLFAISVFGLVKSNATAAKLETTKTRRLDNQNNRDATAIP